MPAELKFKAVRVVVRGSVQGIGFRWFARQEALRLGLVGGVRNLRNGSVEVVAEGPMSHLEQFNEALRRGPMGSQVGGTEIHWEAPTQAYATFEIWVSR